MPDLPPRRVELIDASEPGQKESARIGFGLLAGLFLGRSSLMGAATGQQGFEVALAHFVLVVLVCVSGILFLGYLFDRYLSQSAARGDAEVASDTAVKDPDGRPGAEPLKAASTGTGMPEFTTADE